MYPSDQNVKIIRLTDIPDADPNDPQPHIFSNEHNLYLIFYTNYSILNNEEEVVVINFSRGIVYRYGTPNEEAIEGHPLYSNGLRPYMAAEIDNSPWIMQLEQMNQVHPRHNPDNYKELKHFVLTFHDSTFECVAEKYSITKYKSNIDHVIKEVVKLAITL